MTRNQIKTTTLLFSFIGIAILYFCISSYLENKRKVETELEFFNRYNVRTCLEDKKCIKRAFKSIAFGSEYRGRKPDGSLSSDIGGINKFPSGEISLSFFVEGDLNKKTIQALLETHAHNLWQHSEVKINFTGNKPHIIALFVSDYEKSIKKHLKSVIKSVFKEEISDGVLDIIYNQVSNNMDIINNKNVYCSALNIRDDNSQLILGLVFIKNNYPPNKLSNCIQEEVTQVMGLEQDNSNIVYSFFNDRKDSLSLTKLDFLLLKILYSNKIKSGMKWEEVDPILDEILFKKGD